MSSEATRHVCPSCNGHPKKSSTRIAGGSVSCSWCNSTLTFNFIRDNDYQGCTCDRARSERCATCQGKGTVAAVSSEATDPADLVECLRAEIVPGYIERDWFHRAAADEIESLLAEVELLRARCEVIPILLGEIELLRATALTDGTEAT